MMADWIAKGDTALLFPLSRFAASLLTPLSPLRGAREREGPTLPLDLGKIRHRLRRLADFVQELEPVLAHRLVVRIHGDLVEEGIDDRPQLCDRAHCAFEVFRGDRPRGIRFCDGDRTGEGTLFVLPVEGSVWRINVLAPVFLLLDAQDVRGALHASEQALAVVGREEFAE